MHHLSFFNLFQLSTLLFSLALLAQLQPGDSLSSPKISVNRRDLLQTIGSVTAGGLLLGDTTTNPQASIAAAAEENLQGPIAVLGASGRTGALCVVACLERGIPVKALTRTGSWDLPTFASELKTDGLLSVSSCDVKDSSALQTSLQGCRAVIYAASASKNGGNPKAIDNDGVVAAGKACLEASVPRYVVLSSTATTRPKSLGYKFTNLLGGIMDEKRKGEEEVISLFGKSSSSSSSYTIVRPGGLEEPKENKVLGASTLEVSQGDVLAGIISRADLAEATVELALSKATNVKNTALEVYYTESAQPCEGRFKSQMKDGVRLHGDTYEELFRGIQPNVDYFTILPSRQIARESSSPAHLTPAWIAQLGRPYQYS
ncbi:unnamed protein product [Cylindrotheca closterium]|uniref:NAD(P)-binding domain-containing protein n=1 Tax=Cylindrotheca closterium TaxID=2856 RepID=A0AAD2CPM4_9STRA|nr:unnamed protein product [Cylindrotheca closterium]